MPKGNFTIYYLPHHGVLDEGEGLEDDGHVGVEDPVDVGVRRQHWPQAGLRTFFILRFCGSPGLEFDNFLELNFDLVVQPSIDWLYRCTEVPHR